jgi:hypothetical protein
MLYSPSPVTSTIDLGDSGEPWSEASYIANGIYRWHVNNQMEE